MKKEFYFFVVLILLQTGFAYSQVTTSQEALNLTRAIPQEEIYVHYNSTVILTGETLKYKLYVVNRSNNELSNISKLGYVEILRENGSKLFQQKIELNNGTGYGDFFVPADVQSGNYKLIAYTQWMKNQGEKSYFTGDLTIINPYTEDQNTILSATEENDSTVSQKKSVQNSPKKTDSKSLVNISTSAEEYGTRKEVILDFDVKGLEAKSGSFSLLVRKQDPLDELRPPDAYEWHSEQPLRNTFQTSNGVKYFPEMRGEILSGKIGNKTTSISSLNDRTVALSIPGRNDILKFARTNEEGIFHFNLDVSEFGGERAMLQVTGPEAGNFEIQLDEKFTDNYPELDFSNFQFKPEMREWLRERSIYNQIENSYLNVKSDEIIPSSEAAPFYGEMTEVYDLDDYNRFPTVKETFVEIIKFGAIRKGTEGKEHFEVRSYKSSLSSGLPTLLLVDGLLVQDHEKFMDFDSRKIDKIGVLRDKYFLGPSVFQGIISIETRQHDYYNSVTSEGFLTTEPLQTSAKKTYFSPDYATSNQERIPDFRYELYWNPDLKLTGKNPSVRFYTSDVSGTYLITLEGFTGEGQPVSLRKTIEVLEKEKL